MLTDLIYYDLKVAALIAVFYLFYMLLLARETTHTLNRVVLLSGIALSAVLPLCIITLHRTVVMENGIPPVFDGSAVEDATALPVIEALEHSFDWSIPLAVVLLAGTIIRLLFVVQSYKKLNRLMRNGKIHLLPTGTQVCVVNASIAPFSWMRTVVLSRADWSADVLVRKDGSADVRVRKKTQMRAGTSALPYLRAETSALPSLRTETSALPSLRAETSVLPSLRAETSALPSLRTGTSALPSLRAETSALPSILAHEEAHVRHRHSYDVVVVEVLTALQWLNPVVWFLRQELRTLHEYEADASVLSRGFDESQYIHLLMQKATCIQACALANGINTHRTKKRIFMMLKPKSNRTAWLKALYVVPIVLISLAMTAKTVVNYKTVTTEDNLAVRIFTENTNGRGESYQICHTPDVKFYRNGKEEAIPGNRSIALEVKNTTMKLNGMEFDENSLPNVPTSTLREIHLDESTPDHFVANLVTKEPIKYRSKMTDTEFVNYVKQQQAAGLKQSALVQTMLNEGNGISRARILHLNGVYGSEKGNLFIVDGNEVSREDFNEIKPEAIASVTVMDVGPAKKVYGEKGRYGATIIETKHAATDATPQKEEPVFDICEQIPSFPGGDAKLMEFIARNIKYPEVATKNGVQGRILVKFIVEKDGSLSNAKVLENPKSSKANMVVVTAMMPDKERQDAEGRNAGVQAIRDEAIRVVNAMPRWTPGKQNGKVVRCHFVIPVTYRLQ